MNTLEIIEFCRTYYYMENNFELCELCECGNDSAILDCLVHIYNTTELDSQEITELWIQYIREGSLDFRKAFQNAKKRRVCYDA